MTKHAKLGASGAHRWRNCAGSINLSEGMPDETTVYAAEGTVAHRLAEGVLRDSQGIALGTTIVEDGYDIEVTQEMADAVKIFVDYVYERTGSRTLLLEQQFDLGRPPGTEGPEDEGTLLKPPGPMYGTADAVIWDEETRNLHVVDYKHGAGVSVDAIGNDQGLVYMIGAVIAFGKQPATMTFTIVQPRAPHDDGIIRSWTVTWEELCEAKKSLFVDAEATLDPDAPLNAGDWCRWCPAKAVCPAQRALVESMAVEAFAAEPTFPVVEALSLADLAEVLAKAPAVADWISAVQSYALNMLQRGETIPGFKLVDTRPHRKWVDEKATDKYLRNRKLKVGERFNQKLISPAQAEKILKDKPGLELPDRFWMKPEGRAALAPLSDKRPEKLPGVHEAFGVIAEITEEE
ncbi:MAG: DUF2800 domain-containing protein [Nitrospiraceae bacterium]